MEQTEMSDSDQSPPSPVPKDLRKVSSPVRSDAPNRPRPVSSYNSPIVSRISNTSSSTRSGSPVSSGKDRTKNETPTKKDRRISNSRKNINGVKSAKEPEGTIVIVGIDFGTTASGFAYADAINPNVIEIFDDWPCWQGYLKTSTSILYDSITGTAVQWGEETQVSLIRKRRRLMNSRDSNFKELEAFKMIIVKYGEEDAVELWKKAVVDYLTNFGAKLQQALQAVYPSISLSKNASIILSIPSFFTASVQSLLCECFERALSIPSSNLHFVYESVASAVYCMRLLPGHHEDVGCKFLVVTCGGETVQLTVRQLMENDKLRECTIQTGEICGAMEVEKEFEAWFSKRVGIDGLAKWKKEYYGQWKYLLHVFIKEVKYEFTGIEENFRPFRLDLLEFCPNLKYLVSESYRAQLKSVEWIIDVTFADVKSFFDPIVDKIIKLISDQINQCENVDVMFIVGGFANSEYLVRRIKKEFKDTVKKITVPAQPIAAVLKGSVFYALDPSSVETCALPLTYGICSPAPYSPSLHSSYHNNSSSTVPLFRTIISRGQLVHINTIYSTTVKVDYPEQEELEVKLYTSKKENVTYCDEEEVQLYGTLTVDLPDTEYGLDREIDIQLFVGDVSMTVTAYNKKKGEPYESAFELNKCALNELLS